MCLMEASIATICAKFVINSYIKIGAIFVMVLKKANCFGKAGGMTQTLSPNGCQKINLCLS